MWVRDRLVAGAPHGLELVAGEKTFLEPLMALAAVAGITHRVGLGTVVLLPNRHSLEAGVRHLIFDLRHVFDDFEVQLDLVATEILPPVR